MDDHIPKPVDPEVLYRTLLRWLPALPRVHAWRPTAGADAGTPSALSTGTPAALAHARGGLPAPCGPCPAWPWHRRCATCWAGRSADGAAAALRPEHGDAERLQALLQAATPTRKHAAWPTPSRAWPAPWAWARCRTWPPAWSA
jgi:hypothetical protein